MFTKDKIDEWLRIYESGNTKKYDYSDSLNQRFIEAHAHIDRWGVWATDFIIHSIYKDYVHEIFKDVIIIDAYGAELDGLWTTIVNYNKNCPLNEGIVLAIDADNYFQFDEYLDRCIAVFPM